MRTLLDFFFPRELGRLSYFIRMLPLNVAMFTFFTEDRIDLIGEILELLAVLGYMVAFVIMPRMRHAGMKIGWVILAFIPIVDHLFSIVITFRPHAYRVGEIGSRLGRSRPEAAASGET